MHSHKLVNDQVVHHDMHCTGATTVGNTMSLEFHSVFSANVVAGTRGVRSGHKTYWYRAEIPEFSCVLHFLIFRREIQNCKF